MSKNDKIKNILKDLKLFAIIITDRYNMNYLSNYMGDTGMLVYIDEYRYLLTDSRYIEIAQKQATDFTCIDIKLDGYSKTIYKLFVDNMQSNKHSNTDAKYNIGFEDESISYKQYEAFANAFSEYSMIPLKDKIDSLRQVKAEGEIKKISKAEAIGDAAFAHIVKWLKQGYSEKEIALELEVYMKKKGADGLSFDTIAASGPNSSMPHAVPTDRKLQEGDFLTMDFGCLYEGYCSDMTRTVYIGDDEPSPKQQEVYNTVLKAQLEAISMIKPGVKCSDVDKCARDIIAKAGYGEYFGHSLGHSVGLFIHEEPRLSSKCDTILEEGMVVTVEPGIYLPGEFGVRIEDVVVVTADGCRNLTQSSKSMKL